MRLATARRERIWGIALALLTACGGAAPEPRADEPAGSHATKPPDEPGATGPRPPVRKRSEGPSAVGDVQRGEAVWYGADWHGKPTASGERFDRTKMTAAHRTLPLGAMVRVTNERNGASVNVRINDRGPYGKRRRRIIDVSEAAARVLKIVDSGSCPVSLEVISLPVSRKGKAR